MTKVAVLTIFKDEGHIIREWCLHNLNLGFDHLYMVNNNSNDDYRNILDDLDSTKITLLHDNRVNQQITLIREYYSKIQSQYDWVFITDLDEFLYFNNDRMTVKKFLREQDKYVSYIKIQWTVFILQQFRQPRSIVNSNTICLKTGDYYGKANCKCFYKTSIPKNMISVHGLAGDKSLLKKMRKPKHNSPSLVKYKNQYFKYYLASDSVVQINHYCYQSLEFLLGIKISRGGGNFNDTKRGGSKWIKFIKKKNFVGIKYAKINSIENTQLKKKNYKINEILKKCPHIRPRVDLYENPLYNEVKKIMKFNHMLIKRYDTKEDIISFYNFTSKIINRIRLDNDIFNTLPEKLKIKDSERLQSSLNNKELQKCNPDSKSFGELEPDEQSNIKINKLDNLNNDLQICNSESNTFSQLEVEDTSYTNLDKLTDNPSDSDDNPSDSDDNESNSDDNESDSDDKLFHNILNNNLSQTSLQDLI